MGGISGIMDGLQNAYGILVGKSQYSRPHVTLFLTW